MVKSLSYIWYLFSLVCFFYLPCSPRWTVSDYPPRRAYKTIRKHETALHHCHCVDSLVTTASALLTSVCAVANNKLHEQRGWKEVSEAAPLPTSPLPLPSRMCCWCVGTELQEKNKKVVPQSALWVGNFYFLLKDQAKITARSINNRRSLWVCDHIHADAHRHSMLVPKTPPPTTTTFTTTPASNCLILCPDCSGLRHGGTWEIVQIFQGLDSRKIYIRGSHQHRPHWHVGIATEASGFLCLGLFHISTSGSTWPRF